MTVAEFKKKWFRYKGKETSAYQEHFTDLCGILEQKTPVEADPSGSDWFCFQKRVVKDQELFAVEEDGAEPEASERGFADVWRKDCFAWEYKGKRKNLDEAYKQLLRYRESLLNPPLLVVCDFERFIIRTNFNGTVQEIYDFDLTRIDEPRNWRVLRALFTDPASLKPVQTTAEVTEAVAAQIGEIAKSLQEREAVELTDARTRAEMNFAQRKNLRIARFLNRLVFCFFAEDTGLLPPDLFSNLLKLGLDDPHHLATTMENLFAVMATGGPFGKDKIRHFNGHLFEEATVFELTDDELRKLAEAGEYKWQFIEPSIMGTLFERALDLEDGKMRIKLSAHYTSEADIKTLVEPVLMAPLRREWAALKGTLAAAYVRGKSTPAQRDELAAFQKQLATTTVLDPACGSGNFLYVSLQLLLGLEKEVLAYATQLGCKLAPKVGVQQLRALEINPYAYELAQVSVQIGYLQWRRDNGFDNDRTPVLQNLQGFQNEDALLVPHFHNKAKNLKQAQAEEHQSDDALKFYTEREWPNCDVIVGNPPFRGDKKMRRILGDTYVEELRHTYKSRLAGQSDLYCYWFEKARELIAAKKCKRAGLLASQSIRGSANRKVLQRIKDTGDIFFAISDREWALDGAMVHISYVGFDDGTEKLLLLDGKAVNEISPDLKPADASASAAHELKENVGLAFIGTMKKGKFELHEDQALEMLVTPNPVPLCNSDVIRPWIIGKDKTGRSLNRWLIDFPFESLEESAAAYEAPFEHIRKTVFKSRVGHREGVQSKYWWRLARSCPDLRKAIGGFTRSLVTPAVSKQRFFVWSDPAVVPDQQVITFATQEDWFAGVLESRHHRVWLRRKGNQLREAESAARYNVRECFLTFPFPKQFSTHELAATAKELNDLRERWLNPPEWTKTVTLEFPGSVNGPWARFIEPKTVNAKTGVGTVRYPRLEARDAKSAAELKKRTLTALYNERPAWLDHAHKKLDAAVAAAYGWPADLTDEQILGKLLALNLERAAAEAKAAAAPKKARPQREKSADELI